MQCAIFALVLCAIYLANGAQLPIKRLPHRFTPDAVVTDVGSSLPMKGGVLTLGTYYTEVTIGNPAQVFSVLIDTGSSNLAVPLFSCATCGGQGVRKFHPEASSTYAAVSCKSSACLKCSPHDYFGNTSKCAFGQPVCDAGGKCGFGITYGGGSSGISGFVATDDVCFGGYCVKSHNIVLITREVPSGSFSQPPIDGILGLAYELNACNPTCTTPIFDDISQKLRVPNIFSMCITPSNGGVLDLGEIDSKKYSGELQYTAITQKRWWNIHVLDIKVGGKSINIPDYFYWTTNDVIGGFVDSGTSVFLVAPVIFSAIQQVFQEHYNGLPGVAHVLFSGGCVSVADMGNKLKLFPNVTVDLPDEKTGKTFSLSMPPQSYLLFTNNAYCLGIVGNPGTGIILGDVFMENYYIVFDKQNSRLGFAPLTKCV